MEREPDLYVRYYENVKRAQQSAQKRTSHIIIDTERKLKLRGITNYEFILFIVKTSAWIQSKVHGMGVRRREQGGIISHSVCSYDPTMVRDEHLILCKLPNEYDEDTFETICKNLALHLMHDQMKDLYDFMIWHVKRVKHKAFDDAIKALQTLEEYKTIFFQTKGNDKLARKARFDAKLDTIKLFMTDDTFIGPMAMVRSLSNEVIPGHIDYICDPITAVIRSELNNQNFMNYKVGNLVMIDVDNMYVFDYEEIAESNYPDNIVFEFTAIHDYHRYVDEDLKRIRCIVATEVAKRDVRDKSEWKDAEERDIEDDELWGQQVIEQVDGLNHLIYTWEFGRDVFSDLDDIILGRCYSSDFIKFFKKKGITICMGHQAVDTVKDILILEEERVDLQKQIEELRSDIEKFKIDQNRDW